MKTALLTLIMFCFCPYLARGESARSGPLGAESRDEAPVESTRVDAVQFVPDVSNWTVISVSQIEIRLSENAVAYFGFNIEYQNSTDQKEFVRVLRRHVPLIFFTNKQDDDRLTSEMVITQYVRKEEKEYLRQLFDKSDPFIYFRWKTKEDSQTSRDILDSDIDVWFLRPNGKWLFSQNKQVAAQLLSENLRNTYSRSLTPSGRVVLDNDRTALSGSSKPRNVFVGLKYQLGDIYHILKIDHHNVANLVEGGR